MTKASLAVAILLALTMPAGAQTDPQSTANDMLSGCKGLIGGKTPLIKEALGQGVVGDMSQPLYMRSRSFHVCRKG
jgi:hypothetical protein